MVKLQGEFEIVLSRGGEVSGRLIEDPTQAGVRIIELTWNPALQLLTPVDRKLVREAQDILLRISEDLAILTALEAT